MRVFAEMLGAPQEDQRYLVELGDRLLGQDDPEYAIDPEALAANRHLPFSNPPRWRCSSTAASSPTSGASTRATTSSRSSWRPRSTASPLTQREYDVYFLLLAMAGNETTRHSISNGVLALMEHPDQLERLRATRPAAARGRRRCSAGPRRCTTSAEPPRRTSSSAASVMRRTTRS